MLKYWHQHKSILKKNYLRYRNLISNCDGIIASVFVEAEHNYLAHIAKSLSKKVIVWQHGEQGLWSDKTSDFCEVMFTDYYLYYGKNTREKYIHYKEKGLLKKIEEVGSLKSRIEVKYKQKIIYVTAKWIKNICPFDDMINADSHLLKSQKTLIPYLDKISNKHDVIIKKNNTQDQNYSELAVYPKNDIVEDSRSFLELISSARLIIIDSPSTTALEAASTRAPMFVVNGRVKLNLKALTLLRKRAVVRDSPEELIEEINKFLDNGHYDSDINNNEFCLAYSCDISKNAVKANVLGFLNEVL